jgi:hypothetical protein
LQRNLLEAGGLRKSNSPLFIEAPFAAELMEGLEFFERSSKKRLSVWNLLFSHGDRLSR